MQNILSEKIVGAAAPTEPTLRDPWRADLRNISGKLSRIKSENIKREDDIYLLAANV